MEMAIVMARVCMHVCFRLITSITSIQLVYCIYRKQKLLYPGGASEYSIRRLLADVPEDVDMVIFPNYVSMLLLLIMPATLLMHSN